MAAINNAKQYHFDCEFVGNHRRFKVDGDTELVYIQPKNPTNINFERLYDEYEVNGYFHSPYVLRYEECGNDHITAPLCDGNLSQNITQVMMQRQKIAEKENFKTGTRQIVQFRPQNFLQYLELFKQILSGLQEIHNSGYSYNNLSYDHVLYKENEGNFQICLSNFRKVRLITSNRSTYKDLNTFGKMMIDCRLNYPTHWALCNSLLQPYSDEYPTSDQIMDQLDFISKTVFEPIREDDLPLYHTTKPLRV